jgi:hypothetical protein
LTELFTDFFLNAGINECFCTPNDVKQKFFVTNNNIDRTYIRRVIKNEFNKTPDKLQKYKPFDTLITQAGRPYVFTCEEFGVEEVEDAPF